MAASSGTSSASRQRGPGTVITRAACTSIRLWYTRLARRFAMNISLHINGKSRTDDVEPRLLLIHYLREVVGLTGSHIGCETSLCGACTVMLDGQAVKSCAVLAVQANGRQVTTIEGLAQNGKLDPVQQAFWDEHGLQCGFCTPGMIMAVKQVLERNPTPLQTEVRHGIEGNLCRCTGYQHIVNAAMSAAAAIVNE